MAGEVARFKNGLLRLHCPGCGCSHQVPVDTGGPGDWTWNGSTTRPTLSPSLHVHPHDTFNGDGAVVRTPRCHSFVRDGRWQYLGDSDHHLAGQTVPVPPPLAERGAL